MTPRGRSWSVATAIAVLAAPAAGQDASEVFERHAGSVVKVEVLEASSGAPSSVGTAFYAAPSLLVTNYHVVRDVAYAPERYSLRLLGTDGTDVGEPTIVALDPPNDLAILEVEHVHPSPLRLSSDAVRNGEQLFSLGHPADLRTSVVEGVFNGQVENAGAPLLHFSASINPGMSGGPTLRPNGDVVGINVLTAGNQLSFLVPAREAMVLMESVGSSDPLGIDDLLVGATDRLTEFQEGFFAGLLADGFERTEIGRASIPSAPEGSGDCVANPHEIEGERYDLVEYVCYTEHEVLLGQRGSYTLLYLEHMHMASDSLTVYAFHSLISEWYAAVMEWEAPQDAEMTGFMCRSDNLEEGLESEMLVQLCLRRHRKHQALYHLFVRSALLGGDRESVVSTLRAAPISFANALAVTQRWLQGFSWSR